MRSRDKVLQDADTMNQFKKAKINFKKSSFGNEVNKYYVQFLSKYHMRDLLVSDELLNTKKVQRVSDYEFKESVGGFQTFKRLNVTFK